jgi:stage V sporulation protein G
METSTVLKVTNIKVRRLFPDDGKNKVLAIVSIVLNDSLVIHDMKIIKSNEKLFVAMPNHRSRTGQFQDVVNPINQETRDMIENSIFEAYNAERKLMDERRK